MEGVENMSAEKYRWGGAGRLLRMAAAGLALTVLTWSDPVAMAQQAPAAAAPETKSAPPASKAVPPESAPAQSPAAQSPAVQSKPTQSAPAPSAPGQTGPTTPKPIPAAPTPESTAAEKTAEKAGVNPESAPLSSHNVPGINNFGQVTPRLYRGAQPSDKGYDLLQKMGIDIVVNFRNESDQIAYERRAIETRNMKYFSVPWSASDEPSSMQVREFLEIVRANPDKRIFVHCQKGADRTGTMMAIYRIATDKWQANEAVKEMHEYHYHAFWFPHLARYVQKFPQQLQLDPTFLGAVPAPPKSPTP